MFDTLSTESAGIIDDKDKKSKSEPIISTNNDINTISEETDDDQEFKTSENEFNPEETENSDLDEDFNQETEEELLDIPTFLRRQAN